MYINGTYFLRFVTYGDIIYIFVSCFRAVLAVDAVREDYSVFKAQQLSYSTDHRINPSLEGFLGLSSPPTGVSSPPTGVSSPPTGGKFISVGVPKVVVFFWAVFCLSFLLHRNACI